MWVVHSSNRCVNKRKADTSQDWMERERIGQDDKVNLDSCAYTLLHTKTNTYTYTLVHAYVAI